MQDITKKVAYLKGLAEGYKFDKSNEEHNLILGIIDCLDLVSDEINFLESDFTRLEEYVDMVDDDLSEIEMLLEEDEDDFDYDEDENEDDEDIDGSPYETFDGDWLEDWDDEDSDEEE